MQFTNFHCPRVIQLLQWLNNGSSQMLIAVKGQTDRMVTYVNRLWWHLMFMVKPVPAAAAVLDKWWLFTWSKSQKHFPVSRCRYCHTMWCTTQRNTTLQVIYDYKDANVWLWGKSLLAFFVFFSFHCNTLVGDWCVYIHCIPWEGGSSDVIHMLLLGKWLPQRSEHFFLHPKSVFILLWKNWKITKQKNRGKWKE